MKISSINSTLISDVKLIKLERFMDQRGFFSETFRISDFINNHLKVFPNGIMQSNESYSCKNVLRGLHFQWNPNMGKLVRTIHGHMVDMILDLRKGSPSFGQHHAIELTADNNKQFFVPAGFAHGFVVLSEYATFFYKVDKFYEPGNEVGIMYNDADLNIDWRLPTSELIFSEKDKTLGSFAEYAASL